MNSKQLAQRVIDLRFQRHWTQQDLSNRCRLHVTAISQIERGVREPRLSTLNQVARGFNMTVSELLKETKVGSNE